MKKLKDFLKNFHSTYAHRYGSTRSLGLIRIGLVLLIWNRWAEDFKLYTQLEAHYILIGLSMFLSTLLWGVGIFTKYTGPWAAASMLFIYYYLGHAEGTKAYTYHHTYLLCWMTLILSLSPCGRSFSLDRYLAIKKEKEEAPLWTLSLIQLQLAAIYLWSAVDKSTLKFLAGTRLEQIYHYMYAGSDYIENSFFMPFLIITSLMVVVFEYWMGFMILFNKISWLLLGLGASFHLIIYYTLPIINTFSLTMILLYLALIPANKVHKSIDMLVS